MKILCENIKKSYNKPLSEKKSLFSNRYGKNKSGIAQYVIQRAKD